MALFGRAYRPLLGCICVAFLIGEIHSEAQDGKNSTSTGTSLKYDPVKFMTESPAATPSVDTSTTEPPAATSSEPSAVTSAKPSVKDSTEAPATTTTIATSTVSTPVSVTTIVRSTELTTTADKELTTTAPKELTTTAPKETTTVATTQIAVTTVVATTQKNVEVVPTPENFEAILLKNQTVYLSWTAVDHPHASYQVYMAYGNQRSPSKFIHIESTFNSEESLKLSQLMKHVNGNKTLTFLKFKVRTAFGKKLTSNFTREAVIGLPVFSSMTSNPRVVPADEPSPAWKFVVPVVILLLGAILTIIGVYAYRQVRFKRRYHQYMRTHYDTDSEAVSVSNDNYEFGDQPHHLAFSDSYREEDHLVVA